MLFLRAAGTVVKTHLECSVFQTHYCSSAVLQFMALGSYSSRVPVSLGLTGTKICVKSEWEISHHIKEKQDYGFP